MSKIESLSLDERLEIVETVLNQSFQMFSMSPVFAPQAKALELCLGAMPDIRKEVAELVKNAPA